MLVLGVVLSWLSSQPARAAAAASLVEWEAPQSCPGALDVYARLEAALGHDLQTLGKLSRVRGSVVSGPNGYRLALEVFERERRSSRVVESANCDELVDAAVLAILLALSPDAPAPPVAEPLDVPPPNEAPIANSPDAVTPNGPSDPIGSRGFASAAAVVDVGALPHPALGLEVGAGARLGSLSIGAYGVLLAAGQVAVRPGTSVEFELLFGGVRGCYVVLDAAPSIAGCASFEAGRFGALGLDLGGAQRVRDLWLAPGAALEAQWPLFGALRLDGRVEAAVPLTRKQYTINAAERVHAPAVVSSRVYLGLTFATE